MSRDKVMPPPIACPSLGRHAHSSVQSDLTPLCTYVPRPPPPSLSLSPAPIPSEQEVDVEKLVRGILMEMRGEQLLIGEATYHVSASGKLMTCIFPCDVEDAHLVLTRWVRRSIGAGLGRPGRLGRCRVTCIEVSYCIVSLYNLLLFRSQDFNLTLLYD